MTKVRELKEAFSMINEMAILDAKPHPEGGYEVSLAGPLAGKQTKLTVHSKDHPTKMSHHQRLHMIATAIRHHAMGIGESTDEGLKQQLIGGAALLTALGVGAHTSGALDATPEGARAAMKSAKTKNMKILKNKFDINKINSKGEK